MYNFTHSDVIEYVKTYIWNICQNTSAEKFEKIPDALREGYKIRGTMGLFFMRDDIKYEEQAKEGHDFRGTIPIYTFTIDDKYVTLYDDYDSFVNDFDAIILKNKFDVEYPVTGDTVLHLMMIILDYCTKILFFTNSMLEPNRSLIYIKQNIEEIKPIEYLNSDLITAQTIINIKSFLINKILLDIRLYDITYTLTTSR